MNNRINKDIAQKIVETVKNVCGYNINYIDKNGIIFASTDFTRIGDYHEVGEKVANSGKTIEVFSNESFSGTKEGVNLPFFFKNELLAVIGISGNPKDVTKYGYLALQITKIVMKEHELNLIDHEKATEINYFIRSLISDYEDNRKNIISISKKYNIDLKAKYRIVVIHIESNSNSFELSNIEQNIYKSLEYMNIFLYTFQYPSDYVIVIDNKNYNKVLFHLNELAFNFKNILRIGIGKECNLENQKHSYETAMLSLNSFNFDKNIICFDKLDLDILLGSINEYTKNEYIDRTISNLSIEEINILKLYYKNNMSLKKTSDSLFIHKNTLQYKLDTIYKKTGYNPREFVDATKLFIALIL